MSTSTCRKSAPLGPQTFSPDFWIRMWKSLSHQESPKKKEKLYRWPCRESENWAIRPTSTAREAPIPATTNVGNPAQQWTNLRARSVATKMKRSETGSVAKCSEAHLSLPSPKLPGTPQWPSHWTASSNRRNPRRGRALARPVKHTRAEVPVSRTGDCWGVSTAGQAIRGRPGGARGRKGGRRTAKEMWWTSSFG